MSLRRSFMFLGAGVVLTLAAAGCSGDKNASVAAGAAGGVGQSVNLSQSAAKLSELKSFRFTANVSIDYQGSVPSTAEDALGTAMLGMFLGNLKDVKIEGAVIAPDKMEVKVNLSGQQLGFVQIADKAWVNLFGAWMPVTPEDLGMGSSINFGDFAADQLPPEVVQAAKVTREKVNGVETTRYSFDKAALQKLAEDSGSGQDIEAANMDLWLTDDGIPMKLAADIKGKDSSGQRSAFKFDFTLRDLNGNFTIKAPN